MNVKISLIFVLDSSPLVNEPEVFRQNMIGIPAIFAPVSSNMRTDAIEPLAGFDTVGSKLERYGFVAAFHVGRQVRL